MATIYTPPGAGPWYYDDSAVVYDGWLSGDGTVKGVVTYDGITGLGVPPWYAEGYLVKGSG